MSTTLNPELQEAPASQADNFALPKSDIADLLRSSPSQTPLDEKALIDGCAGSFEFLMLMLSVFQSNAEAQVDEIARQVEAGDSDAVAEAAGKLRASADAVSADPLRALAATLEQFAGLMDPQSQERVVTRLRQETNHCLEHIPLLVAAAQMEGWAT